MPVGKLASQAGHAFLDSYNNCLKHDPQRAHEYFKDGQGTKVVLECNYAELLEIYDMAQSLHLPSALVVDVGHIMLPHFDGNPIATAVGIGPLYRSEADFIRKLKLVK